MLNVSCQKQTHCASLPADSPTKRRMEFVGRPRPSGASNLLGVPGLGPLEVDDDECEVVIGIRPKSSPLPRRRSSDSDEDWEPGPPPSASRRVSFADAKGLTLVHVKEFETWNGPKLPAYDSSEGQGSDGEVYFLSPLTFCLPLSTEELFLRVQEQKIELETIELLPGTTVLKGVIRVLNVSFNKAVYIRTTLDAWSSHFDLLAEYVPASSDGATDRFSFKLPVVPPLGQQGARVDFCLRYETPSGTFWANNNGRNYVLFCHRRARDRNETKSCLKTVGQSFSTGGDTAEMEASSTDVPDDGANVDSLKAEKTSDGPSAFSEEDRQKLLTCSQRRSRKAARMARVRDYFSQRRVGSDDTERDEEKQKAAQEETPEQETLPEGSDKLIVLRDKSPACDTENCPSIRLAEKPAAAECQDIDESVSAEEKSQKAPPADPDVPEERRESADRQTNSFSFGTVVAPLYHQMFGRVGNKNPVQSTLHAEDSSPRHTERGQVHTGAKGPQGQDTQSQHSNPECLVPNRPPLEQEERSLSVTANNITDHKETVRHPDHVFHYDQIQTNTSEVHSHAAKVVALDSWSPRKPAETRETREATSAFMAPQPSESVSERVGGETQRQASGSGADHSDANAEDDACETEAASPTAARSREGEAIKASHGFSPKHTHNSDTEETEMSCGSSLIGNNHVFVELTSEDAQSAEHHEMDSRQEELAGVNWEAMVEEEEKNILTDEEAVANDHGQLEDAGRTTAIEKKYTAETVEEEIIFEEIKAARQKYNEADEADVSETNGEESGETKARKGAEEVAKEFQYSKAPNEAGEEDLTEEIKEEKREKQEFDIERKNVRNKEEEGMEVHLSDDDQAGLGWEDQVKPREVHLEEDNPHHSGESFVVETEESEMIDAESKGGTMEDGQNEEHCSEASLDVTQNKVADALSALVNNVQDSAGIDTQHISSETHLCKEDDYYFFTKATLQRAVGAEKESAAWFLSTGEPENDPTSRESASAESDSDDEVELYMHCLRAVHSGAQADRSKDAGFGEGKSRPPVSRGKLPPMPSISECQDEEQHPGCLREDEETAHVRPTAAAPPTSRGQEDTDTKVSRRKEAFSCSEISKILLLVTLLVGFFVVAYRYDFLACLGLYLVSVVWLYCQEERQQQKQQNRLD